MVKTLPVKPPDESDGRSARAIPPGMESLWRFTFTEGRPAWSESMTLIWMFPGTVYAHCNTSNRHCEVDTK